MKPISGWGLRLVPPGWLRQQVAWQAYLAEAEALGYSEREARAIVAGIVELAKQCPWEIDIFGMAKLILARGDIEK